MKYLLIPMAALLPAALLFIPLSSMIKMTELEAQVNDLEEELKNKSILVIGVQGGKGSFNELAAQTQMALDPNQKFELKYLHTTENVLSALDKNEIEIGQFAVRNTLGGKARPQRIG